MTDLFEPECHLLSNDLEQIDVVVVDDTVPASFGVFGTRHHLADLERVLVNEANDLQDSMREILHLPRQFVDNNLQTVQDAEELLKRHHLAHIVERILARPIVESKHERAQQLVTSLRILRVVVCLVSIGLRGRLIRLVNLTNDHIQTVE